MTVRDPCMCACHYPYWSTVPPECHCQCHVVERVEAWLPPAPFLQGVTIEQKLDRIIELLETILVKVTGVEVRGRIE